MWTKSLSRSLFDVEEASESEMSDGAKFVDVEGDCGDDEDRQRRSPRRQQTLRL